MRIRQRVHSKLWIFQRKHCNLQAKANNCNYKKIGKNQKILKKFKDYPVFFAKIASNQCFWAFSGSREALIESQQGPIAETLIANGADLNATNDYKMTPLHGAAAKGHIEVVKLLVAYGADVNVRNEKGQTALDLAEKAGHKDIVELLSVYQAIDEMR